MSIEVKVPILPESVADGTLVNWKKNLGELVKQGESLVELETDKVVLDIPSPADGILQEIMHQEGESVITGEVIAILEENAAIQDTDIGSIASSISVASQAPESVTGVDLLGLSPAVRRLAAEYELDVTMVTGSGKGGRVTKADVLDIIEGREQARISSVPAAALPTSTKSLQSEALLPTDSLLKKDAMGRLEQRVPMTRLRARIAERLLMAKQTTAMLTTFNEINMNAVMGLRNQYKEEFENKHGVRLGFMGFFAKAVVEALKHYPSVNASIDGNDIIYHSYYDIGIAIASQRGLVVPILRNVDQMSLSEIEKAIFEFGKKASEGNLTVEEITGGTFTITNGGVFGSLMSMPILNPPQSGILGMHAIKQRPIVENNQVVIRPMMYVAHSYDHRIIDGREAVTFLVTIKEYIEAPARLMLQL